MVNDNRSSPQLNANMLWNNPKIAKAKELLLAACAEESQKLTSIRPAYSELKQNYSDLIDELNGYRGSKLRYPYIGSGLGNGALVELLDGSVKYDFITGIGVNYFGHTHPEIISAGLDGLISDTVMQGNLQQNGDSLELCRILKETSKLPHAFLSTSGAMALENGLKIAFQKRKPADRILAFEHCFAGRTLTLSQISDKPSFREGLPSTVYVDYIPFYDSTRPEESTEKAVAALKKHLARYPSQYAVMIFELVQGEGGCYPGSSEFFTTLMKILKEQRVAILVDEIQTFGRLPELYAYQYFNLQEYVDICTIGKLSLVCATLFSAEYNPRSGLLSQTFTSSTVSLRTSKTIIETLLKNEFYGLDGKIAKIHAYFATKLEQMEKRNPHLIKGPYGMGGFIAFTPYGGDVAWVTKFTNALFEAGVICFTAGSDPMRIRMLPPIGVVTFEDIDRVCEIIEETLIKEQ